MPIQVLPYVQSPLEQLTPYIQQFAGDIGTGLGQRSAMQKLQQLEAARRTSSQISPEGKPTQGTTAGYSPSELSQITMLAKKAGLDSQAYLQGALQEQKMADKEAQQIRAEERKEAALQKKEQSERRERSLNVQKTIDSMSSMLAKDLPGIGVSPLTKIGVSRKGVESREAFNRLGAKVESILLPMVNKGTLARERFNFILQQIPKASDSQRAIAGKIRGLAAALEEEGFPINTKILDAIPWTSKELKEESQAAPSEKQITEDVAHQILKEVGGDKEKARARAKELGYEF